MTPSMWRSRAADRTSSGSSGSRRTDRARIAAQEADARDLSCYSYDLHRRRWQGRAARPADAGGRRRAAPARRGPLPTSCGARPRTRRRRAWSPRSPGASAAPTHWGLAEVALAAGLYAGGHAGETPSRWCCTWRPRRAPTSRRVRTPSACRTMASRSTTRRSAFRRNGGSGLACDASVMTMLHDADGHVLYVGRRTRTMRPLSDGRCAPDGARALNSRLFGEALRRPPHRPLDGRRARRSRQPGAAVPAAPSTGPRRRVHTAVAARTRRSRSSTRTARSCGSPRRSPASTSAIHWRPPPDAWRRKASSLRRGPCPPGTVGRFNLGYAIDVLYVPKAAGSL